VNISGRFWLEDGGKAFVGRGRVELLEKIRDNGSINAAAKSMKMAYKAAWDAVDAINRVASQPVVLRIKGGRSGGGTRLTPYGLALIESYRNVEREHQDFLRGLSIKYAPGLF
jgi:molybdate transport system regulatory protein